MSTSYEQDSIALVNTFYRYAGINNLPPELIGHLDHVSLQAVDTQHFGELLKQIEPTAEEITVLQPDDRFIATAKLSGSAGLTTMIRIGWVEIIEPTPSQMRQDVIRNGGLGYYYDDLDRAQELLSALAIPHAVENEFAETIVGSFNGVDVSGEFRISNTPLGQLVDKNIQAKRVTFFKRAA